MHTIDDLSLDSASIVQSFQSESIHFINLSLLHWDLLSELIDLSKPAAFHRVYNGIVHKFDHEKGIELLESLLIGNILVVLNFIVQIWQETGVGQVIFHIGVISVITSRSNIFLKESAVHIEDWEACEQIFNLATCHFY